MRTRFALAVAALLALLMALGSFMPAASHAAPAQRPSMQATITGTLVATPQTTLPATLLLQVGSQTIPVSITSGTHIVDSANNALSLSTLHDGDTLQVTGDPNAAGGINATVVQDLTTPVPPPPPPSYQLTAQGTLAAAPNPATVPPSGILCLLNAHVTSSAVSPRVTTASPCSFGQLPVYLTSSTQILDSNGAGTTLAQLQAGDTLQVTGTLANAQFTAATVQDLTAHVTPPPPPPSYQLTVQGTLAATPNPATVPPSGILCLLNAHVTSSAVSPRVTTASPCPFGQLPVYLTSSTQILDSNGAGTTLGLLQAGDTLQVTGTLANEQLTAATVQDLSRHVTAPAPPPTTYHVTLQGTLVAAPNRLSAPVTLCLQNAHVTNSRNSYRVSEASPCAYGQVPVHVTGNTTIHARHGARIGLDWLRARDTLEVAGTITNTRFTASTIKDLSIQRSYSTLVGTVLYVNPAANGAYFTIRYQQERGNTSALTGKTYKSSGHVYVTVTIYVESGTRYVTNGYVSNQVTVLNPGQTVTVYGIYNGHTHHCTDTYLVRIH